MALDIRLLGPPKVLRDETPVPLRGHRPLALLAYLVVTGKAHTRTHLTDLLFAASADPRAGLRWTLTKLRQAIGPDAILANREQVAFDDRGGHRCDVDALLDGDLNVYRGGFLEGLVVDQAPLFEEWQLITAQQLRQAYQDGLLDRIERCEMRGEHRAAAALAARLVQMDNLREAWRRKLMRAYAALGQWEAACEQYEQCRQLLHEELATTPSEETVALWRQLRRRQPLVSSNGPTPIQTPDEAGRADDPWPAETGRPAKLPFFRTSFVGRQAEIQEIQSTLADPACRLLTVVGPGGIGKTRLAIQAAMNLERRFEQGIFFVPLRQVTGSEAIASTIARGLDVAFHGSDGLRAQLLTFLKRKSILLLLDNMEHLLTTPDWTVGEALLAEIVARAPAVCLLVTSRERLHMPEEWLCTLAGLGFPNDTGSSPSSVLGYPATQLFVQRARQLDPAYHPDRIGAETLRHVVAICQQTAGLPLALEMAATWVHAMPCAEIADSLDGSLSLLSTRDTEGSARHASMTAVFEHSWRLLTPDLQQLLARLSVFRGRFDREAASAVAGATLFTLSALIDKSLLETTDGGRYQVHELLRQFAADKLAERPQLADEARERHSIYYCDFCCRQEPALKDGRQNMAVQRLERALANLQPAFFWALNQGEWTRIADASFALGYFCIRQGYVAEGKALFSRVVAALEKSTIEAQQSLALTRAYYWLGQLADEGDEIPLWDLAASAFQFALASGLDTDFDEALVEEMLALKYQRQGDEERSERCCMASVAAARRAGDAWAEARAYEAFAYLQVWRQARYRPAIANAEKALRLQRAIHDLAGMLKSLRMLSFTEAFVRNYERALRLSQEALVISLSMDNDLQTAAAHRTVSWSLLLAGRFDECLDHLHHAYAIYAHYGHEQQLAELLYGLSWRNCMGGHYAEARRYADELQLLLADKEGYENCRAVSLYVLSQLAFHDGRYAAARAYAEDSCAALTQNGSHNQLALAQIMLGFADLAHDDLAGAVEQAYKLLSRSTTVALWGLGVIALVLVQRHPCEESYETFYELLALQRSAAPMCDSPSYREIIEQLQPPSVTALSCRQRAQAEARGRALDADVVIPRLRRLLASG